MKVGVIGVGAMGQHHARVYHEMDGVELIGVSDVDRARAEEIAAMYGARAFTDYKNLLSCDLDAVSVAVPTTLHKTVAMDVINEGVHILVEKPIASTVEDAEEMLSAAEAAGVRLMVGHIERYNPAVARLKEIIDSGMLGRIVSMSARRVGPHNPRIRDVGIIMDLGVHDIDTISYLYDAKAESVYAIAGNGSPGSHENHAAILMQFGMGRAGMIDVNWLTPHKVRQLTVVGTEGVAYLDYISQTVELHDGDWIRSAKVVENEPLVNELEYFIGTVGNQRDRIFEDDGRYVLKTALAAVRSYREGRLVAVEG
ncbi:MAG: UDP-N-acetylglucosamine 3-dehydrogenase [Candidatus Methanogaster sp.]|nr:MAG: UDP-N-acetylglucosamine 3-dehydrogenase [ANME-2 cluster archaeon]